MVIELYNPNANKKPPYVLGLLCLIPIVGIVFGIILIYKGTKTFKNTLLTVIGIIGLIFNIGFFSIYYYKNTLQLHDFFSKKAFVPYSQGELNSIVKQIEFYKIQHGVYPDNLEQLREDGSSITIQDVLQTGQGKEIEYNYEKINDKYIIFSSGLDGIPNTSDDLYPTIVMTDSSKFGFIKRK